MTVRVGVQARARGADPRAPIALTAVAAVALMALRGAPCRAAVTVTAAPAPDLQALFAFAPGYGWMGGDSDTTLALQDGRTLWLFAGASGAAVGTAGGWWVLVGRRGRECARVCRVQEIALHVVMSAPGSV